MSLHVQIVSDLHIEFTKSPTKNWKKIIKPSAPYLFILGDLCPLNERNRVRHFLEKICPHFQRVIYVFGNHEFFSENIKKTINTLSKSFKTWAYQTIPNITILDNKCIELDGYIVVGATLWTFIPSENAKKAVEDRNDFRVIAVENKDQTKTRWITVKDMNRLHRQSVTYIEKCIHAAEQANKPVIVLTHHAPLHEGTSDPVYEIDHTASTDLSPLFRPNVRLWAFGHTHHNADFMYNNTRVYSNPRGYGPDKDNIGDPCFTTYNQVKTIVI